MDLIPQQSEERPAAYPTLAPLTPQGQVPSRTPAKYAILGLFLVAVSAAAGYGWYSQDSPERALKGMPAVMAELRSFAYAASIRVNTSPDASRQADLPAASSRAASAISAVTRALGVPTGAAAIDAIGENLAALPAAPQPVPASLQNIEAEARVSGKFAKSDDGSANLEALLDLSVKQAGERFSLGAEFRSIDNVLYFRLVELPVELFSAELGLSPFGLFDPTALLKQWYSIKTQTLTDMSLVAEPTAEASAEESELRELVQRADLFGIRESSAGQSIDGIAAYYFRLEPKEREIAAFLGEAIRIDEGRNLTKREEEELIELVSQIRSATIEAWIAESGWQLLRLSLDIPDFDYEGLQFRTRASVDLREFDTAVPAAPASHIQFDDTLKQLFAGFVLSDFDGAGSASARDSGRITDIHRIQGGLKLYYDANGSYPADLSRLVPDFLPSLPDGGDGRPEYRYAASTNRQSYHLGASLESQTHPRLRSDRDCNSKYRDGCTGRGGFPAGQAFDGGDLMGCSGEPMMACYDVTE